MSDNKSVNFENNFDELCCSIAENMQEKDLEKLSNYLKELKNLFKDKKTDFFSESLELVVESFSEFPFSPLQEKILLQALNLAFDSVIFRDRYAALCKQLFKNYANPTALAEAIGLREENSQLDLIARRIEMMIELKVGAFCFDLTFGLGKVFAIDDFANEVNISLDRKRSFRLRQFFDSIILIKQDSELNALLNKEIKISKNQGKDFISSLSTALLSTTELPKDILQRILCFDLLSEQAFLDVSTRDHSETEAKQASDAPEFDPKSWDNSRAADELIERLTKSEKPAAGTPINWENIGKVLTTYTARREHSDTLAHTIALIAKEEEYLQGLQETLKNISADKAEIWSDLELFVETSDKLPGKLVAYWLKISKLLQGNKYLLDACMLMPYKLWVHVERLIKADKEKTLFAERVFEDFEEGKVSADHYLWLWKEKKSDLRSKYISDSYLLFKTLRNDVKGNYLRAKRNILKLLIHDEQFQREVMRMGDPDAITSLIRCAKHQHLLDQSDKQSLLVKIVRLYPEARPEVEEKGQVRRRVQLNITSYRSYEQLKLDLEELINVLVPENVAAIEYARSLGDLRENSEFKFAKERQAFLSKQRNELERRLAESRPVDFSDVEINDVVVPGSSVILEDMGSGEISQFYILGLFDSKPEEKIIACDSPLGQALLGTNVDDQVKLPSGIEMTVKEILPLKKELLDWLKEKPSKATIS